MFLTHSNTLLFNAHQAFENLLLHEMLRRGAEQMNNTVVHHQEISPTTCLLLKPPCLIFTLSSIEYIIETFPRCTLPLSVLVSVEFHWLLKRGV